MKEGKARLQRERCSAVKTKRTLKPKLAAIECALPSASRLREKAAWKSQCTSRKFEAPSTQIECLMKCELNEE